MPSRPDTEPARRHLPMGYSPIAVAIFLLAVVVAITAMLSGLGSRWGWWDFRTGFDLLRKSAYAGIGVGLLSLVGLVLTRPGSGRRGMPLVAIALLVCLTVVAIPWQWRTQARSVPPIHDITTDTESPPEFVAIVPLRADAPNPVEHPGEEVAQQQREAYPDIRPVILDLPAETAFDRALEAARRMGWEIVDADRGDGRIEATDRTFWFGFEDDVVIRLTPDDGRTVVDVRSKSRVGGSDVGTNARRIRLYMRRLRG